MRVEVTGPLRIAGARKGETVDLDPEKVNVSALVEAGHVRVVEAKPADEPVKVKAPR